MTPAKPLYILSNHLSRLTPARLFVSLGLFFGIIFCFLTPPFMVSDEGGHFYRAFELSEGHLVSTKFNSLHSGGNLPKSLYDSVQLLMGNMAFNPGVKFDFEALRQATHMPLAPEIRIPVIYQCPAMYSPIPYIPEVIGIWIGRLSGGAPVVMMYLGRVLTCVATILLLGLAVRITPVHQWTMAAILLTPIVLFQSASLSADALTFGLCFLFVATSWHFSLEPGVRFTRRSLALVALLAMGVCLAKSAYFPLLALLILIPARVFGGAQTKKWVPVGAILGTALGSMAAWGWAASAAYTPCHWEVANDPAAQMRHVLGSPLTFLNMLKTSVEVHKGHYFFSMLGGYLSWLDLVIPRVYIRVIAWSILIAGLCDGVKSIRVSIPFRVAHLVLAVAMAGVVALLIYLSWNAVAAADIEGLTGRYAVPMLPLIMLLVYNRQLGLLTHSSRWLPMLVTCHGLYCGILTIVYSVLRFY